MASHTELEERYGHELIDGRLTMAGRLVRVFARVIDGLILGFIAFLVLFVTFESGAISPDISRFLLSILMVPLYLVLYSAVNGYLLARYGQTVGKRIVGVKIVSFENEQLIPVYKVVLVREGIINTVALIPFIGIAVAVLNVAMLFGRDRRCLHDQLAETKVVKARTL